MITKLPSQITASDLPFLACRGNPDGTVTLYYAGDTIPALVDPSVWAAQFAVQETERLRTLNDAADARAHVKLRALTMMTPAQVQAWTAANVTNIAQAQDAIATLAVCVGILARHL